MIGYQGIPGSYSEMAVQAFISDFQIANPNYKQFKNFIDLIRALVNDEIEFAVLPIENSTTGIITRTMDLFRHQPIFAIAEYYIQLEHILWGLPGANIEEITDVFSHPEALSQCQRFFHTHPKMNERPYLDTALSAQKVVEDQLKNQAALSSRRAGEIFGLSSLAENIQNEDHNQTRFLVLKKEAHISCENVKKEQMLIYVETSHEPGALFKLMQVFNVFQCNLLALNARPIETEPFLYGFFIEIDLVNMIGSVEALIMMIGNNTAYHQIIGSFSSNR